MDDLLLTIIIATLTGFVAGVFGNYCHQIYQRNADRKRWEQIKKIDATLKDE